MFEKSLSQVRKIESDIAQAKQDLETIKTDEAAARERLCNVMTDAASSKAVIAQARKDISDIVEAFKAKEGEITDLEQAIPKAREAAIEAAKAEFTEAVQRALDATDIPTAEIVNALQIVVSLADRCRAAWQGYSAAVSAWSTYFPTVAVPPHAQPPETRLIFQSAFIDAAKKLHGPVDYALRNTNNHND